MIHRILPGILLLGCAVGPAGSTPTPRPPNIVVIFTDDHGYADLSCQGIRDDIRTPHIDALAAGGVRMTSGYVTAPQCVPSRAGLLSGRYQNRFGVESNGKPLEGFHAQVTLPERLQAAGYATGMVGKWHLGPTDRITTHGFDDVFYRGGHWTNVGPDGRSIAPGPRSPTQYHLDAGSAAAAAFIRQHHREPFFLYLAYRAPHVPLDAPKKYLQRFPGEMPERRRQALAMLSAVDDGVGGVMDTLREHALEEHTLVFFIGDNGAPLKIHKLDAPGGGPGWDGSLNDPMNGEKGMLSEGGIRVPFVVSWKGIIPAGKVYHEPVISLDVAATALARAGLPTDELDGVDLVPYLRSDQQGAPHDALYWRWISQSAVREGRWKYLRGGDRAYLYDLAKDPEEKHNLIAAHPETAQRLLSRLGDWSAQLSPPGLATNGLAEVWTQYFDFYLEGKPPPPPRSAQAGKDGSAQGWIPRNSRMTTIADGIRVVPKSGQASAPPPFITVNGIDLPPARAAKVRLRTPDGGPAGLAWREQGQPDFPPGQTVALTCPAGTSWQDYSVELPARGRMIHLRLLLPRTGADINRLTLLDADKRALKTWRFDVRSRKTLP